MLDEIDAEVARRRVWELLGAIARKWSMLAPEHRTLCEKVRNATLEGLCPSAEILSKLEAALGTLSRKVPDLITVRSAAGSMSSFDVKPHQADKVSRVVGKSDCGFADCPECDATGKVDGPKGINCCRCNGDGVIVFMRNGGGAWVERGPFDCWKCQGAGRTRFGTCETCGGIGYTDAPF